jgi:glycosyltransferase involved in cell wall biosynthesis
MKIVQLVPGSGGTFYCENCLRDAGLCKALRRAGHDVFMVPLYLPPATDDGAEVANAPLFYGGVNVYLQQKFKLFRRTPRWLDRLFDRPGLLRWAAKKAGMTTAEDLATTTLSMLRGEDGRQAKELQRLVTWLKESEKPDLVVLSNALLLGLAAPIREALDVPVVCLLQDEDVFLDAMPQPYRAQAWQAVAERAAPVAAFVAVSRYYREAMIERLGLVPECVEVVYCGVEPESYTPAERPPDPPAIGFLERMCEPKGLDTLIEAFLLLRRDGARPTLRLRIAGGKTSADDEFLDRCRARLREGGALDAVDWVEEFDRESKVAFLQGCTVFSVPARHRDAFGLYILEALATGVPVVLPPRGAFPEIVEATGGGILCGGGDAAALAAGLASLLDDPARARELGRRGRESVCERFSTDHVAAEFAAVCERVCGEGTA